MKFAIIEVIDGKRFMIGYTTSISHFIYKLQKKYKNVAFYENVSLDDLKNNNFFENKFYLVNNNLNFYYVEKNVIGSNMSSPIINIIYECELVEFKNDKIVDDFYEMDITDLYSHHLHGHTCNIIIIGNDKLEKSQLVSNILDKCYSDYIENTLIISSNVETNNFYKNKYPLAKVIYQYDTNEIKKILDNPIPYYAINGSIVFDDCTNINKHINDDINFKELIMNSKNYGKSIIMTFRYPPDLSPNFRSCYDYIFARNDNSEINQRRLYHHYFGFFDTFYKFQQIFADTTHDKNAWLIANYTYPNPKNPLHYVSTVCDSDVVIYI